MTQIKNIDIETMAQTLFLEARGESYSGLCGVACVIMNRFKNRKWYSFLNGTHTIAGVCKKPWQFSCWNPNDPQKIDFTKLSEQDQFIYENCLSIATNAIMGKLIDFTRGADHYHAKSVYPAWAKKMYFTKQIGNHYFYIDKSI